MSTLRSMLVTSIVALMALAACGDDDVSVDAGTDGGVLVFDGGPDDPGDSGEIRPDAPFDGGSCVSSAEACNGTDDDCDGLTDEGPGSELGCGAGTCTGGSCDCSSETMCGAECVDVGSDREHCGACETPCPTGERCVEGECTARAPADVLFLVDNSNSMTEEQASLAAAFPRFIETLTTGDLDGDGSPELPIVDDLHVGVISTDMGTGGVRVTTCDEPYFGDDGIFRHSAAAGSGCAASYPTFLTHSPGDSAAAFADDVSCIASIGIGGCGFEQQLEAVLKSLTPSTSSVRFYGDTTGHGDGANAGFLRDGSVLTVVLVTDEEDCSASEPEIFDPTSGTYMGDLNLRCFRYPSALHPISRYVDGLLALRPSPRDVVFALIAGIPADLVSVPDLVDYDAVLGDPRMQEVVDTSSLMPRLVPSCDVPGRGIAFPPRRMVETARQLDARGAIALPQSICQSDFDGIVEAIAERVAESTTPP